MNSRLGVGTPSPVVPLHVNGEVMLGKSAPAVACNAGTEGTLRYNSLSKQMEFCNGTNWQTLGLSGSIAGWWQFNESAGAQTADSSPFGNTGMLVNGPAWVSGIAGAALNFNGSNSYVTTGFTRALSDFTVCAWFASTGRRFSTAQPLMPSPK